MAEDNKKKEREGLGDHTRNFVNNLFGRDDDEKDTPEAQAKEAQAKKEDRPWDKGIGEYTRDFVGGLLGRDDDDDANKPDANKPDANKPDANKPGANQGTFTNDARDKAKPDAQNPMQNLLNKAQEGIDQAQEQQRRNNPAHNILDKAQEGIDRAQEAKEREERQSASTGSNVMERAREAAERARQKAEEEEKAEGATPPRQLKPVTPKPTQQLNDDERSELERLRKHVDDLETTNQAPQAQADRFYTVQPGDSLRAIAQRYYGDEMQWQRIFEANRDKISNPDLIHPGQEFKIPH